MSADGSNRRQVTHFPLSDGQAQVPSWSPDGRRLAVQARDFAVALPFWIVWELTARGVHRLLGRSSAKTLDILLPQTLAEILVWIAASLTAGFCEEVVFRGYLQKQFQALTGSPSAGVAVQALLFGAAHAYQGVQNVIVITVLGVLCGILALWRRSLRPGMVAHAWSDVYSGLQLRFLSSVF